MNNLIYATYKTFPDEIPELGKPIIVVSPIHGQIAPFVYEQIDTEEYALRVYGRNDVGVPLDALPTFLWVYLTDLLPQSIQ